MAIKTIIQKFFEHNLNLEVHPTLPRAFERKGVSFILKDKKDLVGMEVGVYKGKHAKAMLKLLPIKELYLVDPYKTYEFGDKSMVNLPNNEMEKIKKEAKNRLKGYKHKLHWTFDKSVNVADAFKDEYFDFIYLDGDHTYETVKKELDLYYPKIKKGGVFGGHDFGISTINPQRNGVVPAVLEFVKEKDLTLYHYGTDWWVIKELIKTKCF